MSQKSSRNQGQFDIYHVRLVKCKVYYSGVLIVKYIAFYPLCLPIVTKVGKEKGSRLNFGTAKIFPTSNKSPTTLSTSLWLQILYRSQLYDYL